MLERSPTSDPGAGRGRQRRLYPRRDRVDHLRRKRSWERLARDLRTEAVGTQAVVQWPTAAVAAVQSSSGYRKTSGATGAPRAGDADGLLPKGPTVQAWGDSEAPAPRFLAACPARARRGRACRGPADAGRPGQALRSADVKRLGKPGWTSAPLQGAPARPWPSWQTPSSVRGPSLPSVAGPARRVPREASAPRLRPPST